MDFGQVPFDSLAPAKSKEFSTASGNWPTARPTIPAKPVGSNSEGPAFTTLSQPLFGIPWATGDVFGNSAWTTAAIFGEGDFAAGQTPAFVAGNNGNVFTALGTSTTFGTVASAAVTTIVRTNLAGLAGDYNHNGVVDMADYVLWRDTLNQNVTPGSGADGNGNGIVDQSDYSVWRANFGTAAGSGAGSGSLSTSSVPEPFSALLLAVGAVVVYCGIRPRRLCPAVVVSSCSIRHSR